MLSIEMTSLFNAVDASAWLLMLREQISGMTGWIQGKYVDAPALMLALGVAIAIPVIATVAACVRSINRMRPRQETRPPSITRAQAASTWRQNAWLEQIDDRMSNFRIDRGMVRIGREADNDLCITDPAVHRYHAVLEQTPDAEYIISYVGDPDKDGLFVDGAAIQHQHLRGGEVLEFGAIKLRFAISPA